MAERRVRERAPRLIERRLRKVLTSSERAVKSGRDDELHAARIAIKRLRYTLEFFGSVLGPSASEALDLLALEQERLGTIADVDAFVRTYDEISDHLPPGDPRAVGIAALRTAALQVRARALESLRAIWRDESIGRYPDRLAASISAALDSLSNPVS